MCDHYVVESRDHLFFHCPFAQICWKNICPSWTALSAGIQDQIGNPRHLLNLPFATDIIILVAWAIWNTRNAYIFRAVPPSFYAYRKHFEEELQRLVLRAKEEIIWVTSRLGPELQIGIILSLASFSYIYVVISAYSFSF